MQQGIGDTIRVSLTPEPGGPIAHSEVRVGATDPAGDGTSDSFLPQVTACPGMWTHDFEHCLPGAVARRSIQSSIHARMPECQTGASAVHGRRTPCRWR